MNCGWRKSFALIPYAALRASGYAAQYANENVLNKISGFANSNELLGARLQIE